MDPSTKLSQSCTSPRMPKEGEASVKCALCMKPIPKADVFEKNGASFCGVPAAAQYASQQNQYDSFAASEKTRKFKALIRNVILLAIFAGLAAGAFVFYKQNPDRVHGWLGKAKAATAEGVDATKNKLHENAQE